MSKLHYNVHIQYKCLNIQGDSLVYQNVQKADTLCFLRRFFLISLKMDRNSKFCFSLRVF